MSIVALTNDVREYFEQHGVTASVLFGRKPRAQQMNQGVGQANRVIFQPGDDGGKFGKLAGTHQPGLRSDQGNARSLVNFQCLLTVSVWAVDTTNLNDEGAHMCAAEDLFEHVVRAMADLRHGQHVWGAMTITPPPSERVFGVELRAELEYRFPFLSAARPFGHPNNVITKVLEG